MFVEAFDDDKVEGGDVLENGAFQDVVGVSQGCKLELVAEGNVIFDISRD
jgi:hypothetical protein